MIKFGTARKAIAILANISLLFNSFVPFLLVAQPAYAQEASPIENVNNELVESAPTEAPAIVEAAPELINDEISESISTDIPITTEVGTLTPPVETITPTPEITITPEPTTTPDTNSSEIRDLTSEISITPIPSSWTFEKVELNKEYVAPQNSGVKLTFTKLPENSGNIKIEEITLNKEQIEQTGSLSDKAYDITSDMVDGTFNYNLSLPIPESSKGKNVDIKFAEEISQIDSAQTASNTTEINSTVSATNLDHFTIFIVVDDGDSNFSAPGWSTYPSGYNGDHQYVTSSQTNKTATWTYLDSNIINGAIFVSWTQWDDHATNAVYHLSTGSTHIVNQKFNSRQSSSDGNGVWSGWYRLPGTYSISSGSTVILSTSDFPNGNLTADAVAFVDLN